MSEIGPDKFSNMVLTMPLDRVVREVLFAGTPFVFKDSPQTMDEIATLLAEALSVKKENIVIIGSAKMGFSLDPENYPRAFRPDSDIDIIVVDDKLFDAIWHSLLVWHYFRDQMGTNGDERRWIGARQKTIYWGWMEPRDFVIERGICSTYLLKSMRDLRTNWFNAFQNLSRHQALARWDVSGRLYRTWDHAVHYHVDGLEKIKVKLVKKGR